MPDDPPPGAAHGTPSGRYDCSSAENSYRQRSLADSSVATTLSAVTFTCNGPAAARGISHHTRPATSTHTNAAGIQVRRAEGTGTGADGDTASAGCRCNHASISST